MEVTASPEPEAQRRLQRKILRRSALFTYGLVLATLLVAVVGAGAIAALLSLGGAPFLATWIVGSILIVVLPTLIYLWRAHKAGR